MLDRTRTVDMTRQELGTMHLKDVYGNELRTEHRMTSLDVSTITDWSPGPGPMDLVREKSFWFTFTGVTSDIWSTTVYDKYPVGSSPGFLNFLAPMADDQASTKLAASANPFRPKVNLPVFLAEMKDLPRMIQWVRDLGPKAWTARGMAEANVATQFGVAPLLRDIRSMIDLAVDIERTRNNFSKLMGRDGLRVKHTIHRDQQVSRSVLAELAPGGRQLRGYWTTVSSVHQWGVIRYFPAEGQTFSYTDREMSRLQLGWRLDAGLQLSQAWELIPWSWLIDYFTSIGDLLAASNGVHTLRVGEKWLMCHQRIEHRFSRTPIAGLSDDGIDLSQTLAYKERKRRVPALAPSLTVNLPFITASQASISASLVAMRTKFLRR